MAIDMSQFYQVFFEESAEHLTTMESLLLDLDIECPDMEQTERVAEPKRAALPATLDNEWEEL